jgi:hypothetical protein
MEWPASFDYSIFMIVAITWMVWYNETAYHRNLSKFLSKQFPSQNTLILKVEFLQECLSGDREQPVRSNYYDIMEHSIVDNKRNYHHSEMVLSALMLEQRFTDRPRGLYNWNYNTIFFQRSDRQ